MYSRNGPKRMKCGTPAFIAGPSSYSPPSHSDIEQSRPRESERSFCCNNSSNTINSNTNTDTNMLSGNFVVSWYAPNKARFARDKLLEFHDAPRKTHIRENVAFLVLVSSISKLSCHPQKNTVVAYGSMPSPYTINTEADKKSIGTILEKTKSTVVATHYKPIEALETQMKYHGDVELSDAIDMSND